MKQHILRSSLVVLVVLGLATCAWAQPKLDIYDVRVDGSGNVVGGGGSGYNNGEWFFYPNTGWWNEWFYDHPFDPTRWKEIDYSMLVSPLTPGLPSDATIAINWSSPLYPSGTGQPPIPPIDPINERNWIVREVVWDNPLGTAPVLVSGHIKVPNYNPEWVSIDVMGANFTVTNGRISHECVPEPATLSLVGLGGLGLIGLLWLRRRRA